MKTFERFMGESIVLYCIPGKAWALGLSYPGTSSLNPGLPHSFTRSARGVFQTLYGP